MRLLFALLAVAVAAQDPRRISQESGLRVGKEYRFQYVSQALTGVSVDNIQYAGLQVKFEAILQPISGARDGITVKAKLDNIQLKKLNKELHSYHPGELVPDSEWTQLAQEESRRIIQQLVLPFQYEIRPDRMDNLKTQPDEPYWSINIKRGLLSLMQLDMSRSEPMSADQLDIRSKLDMDLQDSRYDDSESLDSKRKFGQTFTKMEEDVTGVCETVYNVQGELDSYSRDGVPVRRVAKTRDFQKCRTRPRWFTGLLENSYLKDDYQLKTITPWQLEAEYQVQGTGANYLVRSARLVSRQHFNRLKLEHGKLLTTTVQWLQLVQASEAREDIRADSQSLEKQDTFVLDIPAPLDPQRRDAERQTEQEIRAKVQIMENLLDEVVEKTANQVVLSNATKPIAMINLLMRELPLPVLRSIIQQHIHNTQRLPIKAQVLLDNLMSCTRSDIVPVILDLVKAGTITDLRASFMIGQVSVLSTSSPKLATDLVNIVRSGQVPKRLEQTRRATILAMGSVAHKLNHSPFDLTGRTIRNYQQYVQGISNELKSLLQQALQQNDLPEQVLIVKAMGNAGVEFIFDPLKTIINSNSAPLPLRIKAVYALRRFEDLAQPKVDMARKVLMPIFQSYSQPQELRTACAAIIFRLRPKTNDLISISQRLKSEKSRHVLSFVYSYMESMADYRDPIQANRTEAFKTALKYADIVRPGVQYSKSYIPNYYAHKLKSSFTPWIEYITSSKAFIPENFILRNDFDFLGFPLFEYEFGMDLEGVQTITRNTYGPKSLIMDVLEGRLSLKDILDPIQRPSLEMLSEMRTIFDKLAVTERGMMSFAFDAYTKIAGVETNFIRFDAQSYQDIAELLLSDAPRMLRELQQGIQDATVRALPTIESGLLIPTPGGLPLSMNFTWNNLLVVHYHVSCPQPPSLRDLMTLVSPIRQGQMYSDKNWRSSSASKMNGIIHFQPSVVMDTEVAVGLQLGPYFRTGSLVHSKVFLQMPLRTEIELDPQTGKLKTKIHLPQKGEKVIELVKNTKTFFVRKPAQPQQVATYVEEKINPFPLISHLKNNKIQQDMYFTDNTLTVYDTYQKLNKRSTLASEIFFYRNVTVYLEFGPQSAKEIKLESVVLGPQRSERSSELIRDVLDVDSDSDSESEDENELRRSRRRDEDDSDSWWWWGGSDRESSRQQHISRESGTPFQRVPAHSSMSSPQKSKVITVIKAKGGRSQDKKIQIQLTHINSADLEKVQHDLQVVYDSPYSSQQKKKVAVSAFTDFSVLKKHLIGEMAQRQSSPKELVSKVEVFYGSKDYAQKYCDAEIKMGRRQDRSFQNAHGPRRVDLEDASALEVSLDIDYQYIPRSLYKLGKEIKVMTKALPYVTDNIEVETDDASNPQNKLKIEAQIWSNETEVVLKIDTPEETEIIRGIPIPFLPRRDAVCSLSANGCYNKYLSRDMEKYRSSRGKPIDSFISYMTEDKFPGKCKVLGKEVHTFDRETVHFPKTDCEIVLAKDCSSSSHPQFMVTTKDKNKDESKKIVHIYTPQHKIKIQPKSGWFESEVQVEVDGREVSVPDDGQEITVRDSRGKKVCDIKKIGRKVEVYSHESQVKVKTDGLDVDVQVHPSYFSQLCGVCSNYNSVREDDLMGPRKEKYSRPQEFLLSYILPSSECNIDEVRDKLARRVPLLFAPKGTCQKMNRNLKTNKGSEVCFSFQQQPKCVGDDRCEPIQPETRKMIDFVCFTRNDPLLQTLEREWESGQKLNFEGHRPNWRKEMYIPNSCRDVSDAKLNEVDKRKQ